ncbi:outer membrane protein transport protein [candidate division KSB1 bacterium]|nr:outer membrane protein transport protein [candidate division KSB1 bacterium]
MIRRGTVILLGCLIMLGSVSLWASNGSQIGTVGARSTAMGSSFTGLADDWSALFFNPAGLTQLKGTTIGISYALITPTGTYQPHAYPSPQFSGLSTSANELREQTFHVPAIGLFFQPVEKLTLGFGLYAPFGLGAEFDLYDVPPGFRTDDPTGRANWDLSGEEGYETGSDHEVVFFQPTVAYEIFEGVSLGLGVGYTQRGKLELNEVGVPLLVDADPQFAQAAALFNLFEAYGVMNPDHERLMVETNLTGKGSSWNLNMGLHVDATDWLSVGVSARIYQDLKLKGTMTQTVHLPGLTEESRAGYEGVIETYVATVYDTLNMGADSLATEMLYKQMLYQIFPGVSQSTKLYAEADLPLPTSLSFGVALKPIDRLTLTVSETFTNWASWNEVDVNLQIQSTTTSTAMTLSWEDTWETAVGAEYRVIDAEKVKLDLRGGFYMVASPVPDETITPTLLDPNDRNVITAGLGLELGKIQLNVAYEKVMMADRDVTDYEWGANGVDSWNENYAGVYSMSADVITFGLTFTR